MRCLSKCTSVLLLCTCFAALVAGSTASAGESLEPPVLVMYEKVGLSGKKVTFNGPVADIDVRFPFHSTSVKAGRWEICTRNNFKGACMDIDAGEEIVSLKKNFGFFARIRSLRPITEMASAPAVSESSLTAEPEIISAPTAASETDMDAPARPVASAAGVLRGHRAHFFKTPMFDGVAIDAENEAAARDFCREAGFDDVEFTESVLSEGRRVVGDLLCADPLGGP